MNGKIKIRKVSTAECERCLTKKSQSDVTDDFARRTWRNDGAEGETVHALCDEVERLQSLLEAEPRTEAEPRRAPR